jgi:hypothetical protein
MVPKSATEQRAEVSVASSMNVELILSIADLRAAAEKNLSTTASGSKQLSFITLPHLD